MDLTEAEDIKKRWQEYTEELYSGSEKAIQGIRSESQSTRRTTEGGS